MDRDTSGFDIDARAARMSRRLRSAGVALMWASLVPLWAIARPYEGLIQDARIYVARGVADRDPTGVGRDLMFADDAQTGFTVLRGILRALLGVLPPGSVSMLLAALGTLLWLAAAVSLALRLARGRMAWAAVVAVLVLPSQYGAFGTFGYGEAIATPRVFAEAAVLAALAAMVDGRRLVSVALLLAAGALHPLMALPGIALAAVLLVHDDRRWLVPFAAAALAVLAAATFGLPLVDRLFVVMDPVWSGILRSRSINLFPTLWPGEIFGRMASRVAAALIAGSFMSGRARVLMRGVVGVAIVGVLASLMFGDVLPSILITQLQLWRVLWLLTVLGNAGLALAAIGSWRAGVGGRLSLAALIVAWAMEPTPILAVPFAITAVIARPLARRRPLSDMPERAGWIALSAAIVIALCGMLKDGSLVAALFRSPGADAGDAPWPYVVASGVMGAPVVAAAVAVVLTPSCQFRRRVVQAVGFSAFAIACLVGAAVWDSRTAERRAIDARDGASDLARALGPATGDVLWIDDDSEAWFLAGRSAFFSAVQGAPILFSRALALAWSERGAMLSAIGLARPADLAPWAAAAESKDELVLTPAALARFCADPHHPAALVAPGAQLSAVPAGLSATLWRPPFPLRRLSADWAGLRWRGIDAFTVVRCAPPGSGLEEPPFLKSVRTD